VHATAATDIHAALSLLEKTPFLLETMLRGLPSDLLQWKPAPDRWSISEVLSHLNHIEPVFADRVRRMITEDNPSLLRYTQPHLTEPTFYAKGSADEHLASLTAARREIVAFVQTAPPSAATRIGHHSELGTITVANMLNEWASHDLGHIRQIAELYRARAFYPHSGSFQQYSDPKP
jgi:hypothetical protein